MKTAIVIDSLIKRDESIFLLELILNLYPDSEIYTIAHKRGGILGPIESRPIVSSYLTHRAKDESVFKKNFWILPSAIKAIPLHPSINKVIVLSRGYIHGLNLPANVEKLLYIIDWNLVDQKNLGWQRVFSSYVNDWREKALRQFPHIAVSSTHLQHLLELPNAEVIEPTYRTEEYPFVKDEDHNFVFTHHLVYTQGLTVDEFMALAKFLLSKKETVRILGPDEHLKDVKVKYPELEFGGDHCEASNAVYTHQAKVVWDLSRSFFPARSLGSLASGRPVVVRDDSINREFLSSGAYFINDLGDEFLNEIYQQVDSAYQTIDRKILRRLGLKWNERLFKSRMLKFFGKNVD